MARVQTMSIPDFMAGASWDDAFILRRITDHLDRHRVKYRIAGTAIILFLAFGDVSYAAGSAGIGIDEGARKIYSKLVSIGKWVIIIKGGIETIKNAADGDFQTVKKGLLGYGITYAALWALPWMLDEIERLFTA